jgi:hypothetical protein
MSATREYFVTARSFAAPFVSDTSDGYVTAETPQQALEQFAANYKHPMGLYAAEAWASADAYHKGEKSLAQWLSNHEQAKQKVTAGQSSYSYLGNGPGRFEVNGSKVTVENPKDGSVVA